MREQCKNKHHRSFICIQAINGRAKILMHISKTIVGKEILKMVAVPFYKDVGFLQKPLTVNGQHLIELTISNINEPDEGYAVQIGKKSDIFVYRRYNLINDFCYFASYFPVDKFSGGEPRLATMPDLAICELAEAVIRRDFPSCKEVETLKPNLIKRLRDTEKAFLKETKLRGVLK